MKTLRGFRFALNHQHCREAASPFFSAKLLLPTYSIKNECSEDSLARDFLFHLGEFGGMGACISLMAYYEKRGNAWRAQIRRNGYPALSATFAAKAEAQRCPHEQ
ncbi:MAG: hypothetical protein LBJ37_08915 [Paucimonas sp.]|nr:hypothetical protein [Paucimonas sp.]